MKTYLSYFSQHLHNWLTNLLGLTPPTKWPLMWEYVGFIGICWLVALGGYFLPIRDSLKSRILTLAWTNALLGPLLFFFRYEGIPLLGMDAWRLVQEISVAIWIITIIQFVRTDMKQEIKTEKVIQYKTKYLPKKR